MNGTDAVTQLNYILRIWCEKGLPTAVCLYIFFNESSVIVTVMHLYCKSTKEKQEKIPFFCFDIFQSLSDRRAYSSS